VKFETEKKRFLESGQRARESGGSHRGSWLSHNRKCVSDVLIRAEKTHLVPFSSGALFYSSVKCTGAPKYPYKDFTDE